MDYIKRDLEEKRFSFQRVFLHFDHRPSSGRQDYCFPSTDKSGNGAILCMRPKLSALNAVHYIVPIWMI